MFVTVWKVTNYLRFCLRVKPKPNKPKPKIASIAGSGTEAAVPYIF